MPSHPLIRRSTRVRRSVLLFGGGALLAALVLTGCGGTSHKSSTSTASGRVTDASLGAAAGVPALGKDVAVPTAAAGATSSAALQNGPLAGTGTANSPPAKQVTALQSRDIVRTASLSIEVADVTKAADALNATTAKLGGRVDSDDRSHSPMRSAQLVLRLDPRTLDTAMAAADQLGTETARTVKGEDVTASNADVNARVAALRTSVGRLQALLGSSANLNDLVSLEGQLTQRQATLDSTVAQQRALADQISLATLTVNLTTRAVVIAAKPHTAGHHLAAFGAAFGSGGRGLATAVRVVLAGLGYALPFIGLALFVAIVFIGIRFGWRRVRRHPRDLATAQDA